MWMICLFAAGYRASSSLALKFQLLTSRSCFGNGGACIVDLIIHYWPDMVIEKHYKPRSYSTIFHRWWRWSLFILLAYRWKEPFDLNVKMWYQPLFCRCGIEKRHPAHDERTHMRTCLRGDSVGICNRNRGNRQYRFSICSCLLHLISIYVTILMLNCWTILSFNHSYHESTNHIEPM